MTLPALLNVSLIVDFKSIEFHRFEIKRYVLRYVENRVCFEMIVARNVLSVNEQKIFAG